MVIERYNKEHDEEPSVDASTKPQWGEPFRERKFSM
jgi:hypothetical protein